MAEKATVSKQELLDAGSHHATVDSLPIYQELISEAFDEEAVKAFEEAIDGLDAELRELSLKIHGMSDHSEKQKVSRLMSW